ncbi:MAG: phage tail assembly protein [Alphaproteobacteria bacterium]|jgi:hypothetical protein|nr:phage tail assembly protein [Alphaproteobacteria bacterium]
MQKEIILKTPIILGTKEDGSISETSKVILREPTAGDLRGLSLKSLVVDSNSSDWIILLTRISQPNLSSAAINIMPMRDFSKLIAGVLEMLGEDEGADTLNK